MSFESHHPEFAKLLKPGTSPSVFIERDWPFAHEGPVFLPSRNELWWTSGLWQSQGKDTISVGYASLDPGRVDANIITGSPVAKGNGAVNYKEGILFCDQGQAEPRRPSCLHYMSLTEGRPCSVLLDSFYGRPFNSINDVVEHSDGSIWFTDPTYGYELGFGHKPQLPSQAYRFDPRDQSVRVVADGFGHPNGICFSPDEKIVYITDTDWLNGNMTHDDTKAATIYAYDIATYSDQPFLINKRVFAFCDCAIPDGIKCDMSGNVYSGSCKGDGIHVWSPGGVLLGKILIPGGVANFCFAGPGDLFAMNETKIWRVPLADHVRGALLKL